MDDAQVIADRYEVLDKLGSGAYGDVFKVWDREDKETRALKLLKAQALGATGLGRFEREYAAISRLEHSNIIRVFDFGMHGTHPYFSMELLEGTDLKAYTQERRPVEGDRYDEYAAQAAYLFYQVADALGTVHAAGIVHRDLKPENIFVKPTRHPRVKLLDFGHARDEDNKNLTRTGTVLGTAWYIPPEQALAKPIGPSADIYSMGCVFFEALVGKPPFGGRTVVEVLMGHMQKPPPDPRTVEPRVPDALADLCLKMIQKDLSDRPATAADVASARSSEPIRVRLRDSSRPPHPRSRPRSRARARMYVPLETSAVNS